MARINEIDGTRFILGERLAGAGPNAGVWVIGEGETDAILKWTPGKPDLGAQERAARTCERLAARDAPVPKYSSWGRLQGGTYAVMTRLRGSPPGAQHFTVSQMKDLLRLVELQAGAAIESLPEPPADRREGVETPPGEARCCSRSPMEMKHADQPPDNLARRAHLPYICRRRELTFPELMPSWSPQAADLLERCRRIAGGSRSLEVRSRDIVHQDIDPSNILVEDGRVSGIVDWEDSTSGDRGWDIVEILFCCWERPALRDLVLTRLRAVSPPDTMALFAADMAVGFASGAMVRATPEWANRCVRVGHELLDAVLIA